MDTSPPRKKPRRRPNFPLDFKLRLVEASLQPGVSVAMLARQHDLNANVLFNWRHQYKTGKLLPLPQLASPIVLPVQIRDDAPVSAAVVSSEIELFLPKGRLRIQGRPDPDTLRLLLRELAP
ncbi:IS66-like element accessory protein TnpA [Paludibacterium yongneupense]|uniref:IS66-like element accessory protein TnpA n=1 Tax=Paludibacterium yongneupense TaxID=400061 RepID=UPI00048EB36D|nr:transposase [Paludibacterium yongneupense]